jgi:hypothetical protein
MSEIFWCSSCAGFELIARGRDSDEADPYVSHIRALAYCELTDFAQDELMTWCEESRLGDVERTADCQAQAKTRAG